jgi:hypothetical protein
MWTEAIILQYKRNKYYIFWKSFSSILSYTACSRHAPYCHPWNFRHYHIFPHFLINCTNFEKDVTENRICVFWFILQICLKHLSLRGTERNMIKNVYWSSCEVPLFLSDFIETWTFSAVLPKKYHENIPRGNWLIPSGQAWCRQ